jgi:hypothetical protein
VLPTAILNQHVAVLGKTRSGKSSVIRGLVEDLLERSKPVCIVDPKGDWWGIKLAADGKGPGYPVVIFGGEHADVPINEHAGAPVAELFATGNRPCLIDLGGWMVGPRTRFWIEFASTLFKHTKGDRWLVVDEIHNFAPKGKVFDAEAGKALHWANRLASEGLGKGVSMLFASQRPQKVHNDTLTSAETLIAMRVLHPSDRGAVSDWIKGCGDSEGSEVLNSLANMERGEGWVWSPEIRYGPKRVKFPMFRTYDSFRPQSVDDSKRLKGWAEVDLDEVRAKLTAVVEQAKADDPRELRKQIAELKKQAVQNQQTVDSKQPKVETKTVEKFVLKDGQLARAEKLVEQVKASADRFQSLFEPVRLVHESLDQIAHGLAQAILQTKTTPTTIAVDRPSPHARRVAPAVAQATSSRPARVVPPVSSNGHSEIGNSGLKRILIALAQRGGLNRRQLGLRACLSSRSGTFDTYLSKGRTNGWIVGSSQMQITDAGVQALGSYDLLPEGSALLGYWLGELGNSGASRILRALADVHPRALTRQELGEAAVLSGRSGTFDTYLSKLRTLELIEGKGELKASDELFD